MDFLAFKTFCSTPPPFFSNNKPIIMSHQTRFEETDLLDIQTSWIENIDPLLRNSGPELSWQRQQQQQQQQLQQRPLQRFINAPERPLFTAPLTQYVQSVQRDVGTLTPISAFPYAGRNMRMASPSPSHGHLSSTCSTGRSPAPERDLSYYSPQQLPHDLRLPTGGGGNPRSTHNVWAQQQQYPIDRHVNMSEIQAFPGPQEIIYHPDEGYFTLDGQEYGDHLADIYGLPRSTSVSRNSYKCPTDEGLGASVKDVSSPPAENEYTEPEREVDEDEDEDTEYTPRSTRTRKRRASLPNSPRQHPSKRSRTSKTPPKNKSSNSDLPFCEICDRSDFKDGSALARHIASAHTRPYICPFDFAGCKSTFASKNEWKRHVSSQHLNLHSWICTFGACAKSCNGRGAEFNRKDLFTQHLRRMHGPSSPKRYLFSNKKTSPPQWEAELKDLQDRCLNIKRSPPTRLACPVRGCGTKFEGSNCWDDRMEHVGKHLEKVVNAGSGAEAVVQRNDSYLVAWAVREGIVESHNTAANPCGYRLVEKTESGRGGAGAGGSGRNSAPRF